MGDPFVPEVPKADLQVLLQDYAQSRRELFDERKNSARTIAEAREHTRWEIDRVRVEAAQKVKILESENEALARALGRLQVENDRLREENVILRHTKIVHETVPSPAVEPAVKAAEPQGMQTQPIQSQGGPFTATSQQKPTVMMLPANKVSMVPSQEPSVLGKSVPVVQ
jgi:hypothetical protein